MKILFFAAVSALMALGISLTSLKDNQTLDNPVNLRNLEALSSGEFSLDFPSFPCVRDEDRSCAFFGRDANGTIIWVVAERARYVSNP
ncbi:MAG: hypothetical protein Q4G08_04770 [Capnocytophaga sp.]|nr:hypothetical protein [Capnocytophaga sp.]